MADIINSVDRSLDMYIYDLYIYIDISLYLSIGLSFSIYFGWPTSLPVWSVEPNDAVRAVAVAKRREYAISNVAFNIANQNGIAEWLEK